MKIAIATERKPKIDAVKEVVEELGYLDHAAAEYVCKWMDSGVSDMPLSLEESMQGAKNRVLNLQEEVAADRYIGVEGGATVIGGDAYLLGVTYVQNTSGKGNFGMSGFIKLPEQIKVALYEEGKDLGPLMAELSEITDIRSKNGTYGALSDDMITRKDQLKLSTLTAFMPFFNKFYKV